MMRKAACFAASMIIFGGANIAQADIIDLVTNGDFENGTTGWSVNPAGLLSNIDIDGTGPSGANHVVGFDDSQGGWIGVGQYLSVEAGIEYTFSADLAVYNNGSTIADGAYGAVWYNSTPRDGYNFQNIAATSWEYDTLNFTFTPSYDINTGWLYIGFFRPFGGQGDVTTYVDNISFTYDDGNNTGAAPVPEPATMLLFGTGLAGLAGSRARKKRK